MFECDATGFAVCVVGGVEGCEWKWAQLWRGGCGRGGAVENGCRGELGVE